MLADAFLADALYCKNPPGVSTELKNRERGREGDREGYRDANTQTHTLI